MIMTVKIGNMIENYFEFKDQSKNMNYLVFYLSIDISVQCQPSIGYYISVIYSRNLIHPLMDAKGRISKCSRIGKFQTTFTFLMQ